MPHDRNGDEIQEGDIVMLECVVDKVYPQADFCNVTLKSVAARKPDGIQETFTCNAAVVELSEKVEEAE